MSRWRPGTHFSYYNTGPAIVALIIEKIEHKPFEQIVQERWFTPIGMNSATYFLPDTTKVQTATLYRADNKTPFPYWHVFIRPAGSINANAHDMAAYVRFLLGRGTVDGKELLPRASLERMERSETWSGARAGLNVGYGLHLWRAADSTGFVWTSHNGGVAGGLSDMSYLPAYGVGYAFQINAGNSPAFAKITKLVRAYVTQGLTPPAPPPAVAVNAATAREFTGWYRSVSPRAQNMYVLEHIPSITHVTFTDNGMHVGGWLDKGDDYVAVDSLRFRRTYDTEATLAFVRDPANNRPQGIELQGSGLFDSMGRISATEAMLSMACTVLWLAGLALSVIAMLFGAVRWIVRKLRKQPSTRAAAATSWRVAAIATLMMLLNLVCVALGSADVAALGNLTLYSGGMITAGYLFCLFTLMLGRTAWGAKASTTWSRISLWTVRGVSVVNVVAAAYLVRWGWIGWKTWG